MAAKPKRKRKKKKRSRKIGPRSHAVAVLLHAVVVVEPVRTVVAVTGGKNRIGITTATKSARKRMVAKAAKRPLKRNAVRGGAEANAVAPRMPMRPETPM